MAATDKHTATLCNSLVNLSRSPLPKPVVEAAKAVILDGIGCLVAGTTEPNSAMAIKYAETTAGKAEASIAGSAVKTSAASAAFVNGVLLHSLDYEPQGVPPCHGTSTILPALLALAERENLSGGDVLRAFVLGWDVECRLRKVVDKMRGAFHPSGIYGPLASTAACATLLRLNAQQTEYALGIAASATGGMGANIPTMTKATHAGNAARTGVDAATLGRMGFDAAPGILERKKGIADAFLTGDTHWDQLNAGWGERWFIAEPGVHIKPYAVQFSMLALIEAVLAARPEGFKADKLDYVEVTGSSHIAAASDPNPATGHAGRFSVEYCSAAALVLGQVGLAAFEDHAMENVDLRAIIKKVRIKERAADHATRHAVSVKVVLKDGIEKVVDRAFHRGSVKNPMNWDERLVKVRDCLAHGGRGKVTEQVIKMIEQFDTLSDVHGLMGLLRA